jgi:regulator of protease activity HflC (stomatin/prohibitin superfamily)
MSDTSDSNNARPEDILERLRQMAEPLVNSIDKRLSGQVDKRVDKRVEESLKDRLSVIERAIADLDRAIKELQAKVKD